jgi:hypothetical protein
MTNWLALRNIVLLDARRSIAEPEALRRKKCLPNSRGANLLKRIHEVEHRYRRHKIAALVTQG